MSWLKHLHWPKSLRWHYSLRALIALVTMGCVWGGYEANRAHVERRAELTLLAQGAELEYWKPSIPWNVRYVREVRIGTLSPMVVNALTELSYIQGLAVIATADQNEINTSAALGGSWGNTTRTTDAFNQILTRQDLLSLTIDRYALTDADLTTICAHASLQEIALSEIDLPGRAFQDLLSLPDLRTFCAHRCRVACKGLARTQGSATLERLWIDQTTVTDELGAFVARSPRVQLLMLTDCGIDDNFIAALGTHSRIEDLSFGRCAVTDASIPTLSGLSSLKHLDMTSDRLTQVGQKRLVELIPSAQFGRGD